MEDDDLRQDEAGPSSGLSVAQQAALSSMNGSDLPHSAPLDHDNDLLSPVRAPAFSVDDFLVSRVPATTLAGITAELTQYGQRLDEELTEVVDRDFRGFVNLGAALKAETPRIARLDWKVPRVDQIDGTGPSAQQESQPNGRHVRTESSSMPNDSGSNLGLEKVRRELVSVRDTLRKAESDIEDTLASSEQCAERQEALKVLLSLEDSLGRLEGTVLKASPIDRRAAEQSSTREATSRSKTFWAAFDCPQDIDEDAETSSSASSGYSDDDGSDTEGFVQLQAFQDGNAKLSPQQKAHDQRATSEATLDDGKAQSPALQDQEGNLPLRIEQASSEYAVFFYLQEKASALGFGEYVKAQYDRISAVRRAILRDLERLLRALTSLEGTSLLVHPEPDALQASELSAWSKVGDAHDARREEQRGWLRLCFSMWTALSLNAEATEAASEAAAVEDVICESLVLPFAKSAIKAQALQDVSTLGAVDDATQAEGDALNVESIAAQVQGDGTALVKVYDSVLRFVRTHTRQVTAIAEASRRSLSSGSVRGASDIDVFVHCVWRALSTEVTEQLGGQIFFVGRPMDFQRNYIITMHFLDAFERMAPSPRAAQALHTDSSYIAFKKRWQLPVYSQMRARESITTVQNVVSQAKEDFSALGAAKVPKSKELPLSACTATCADAFARPWTPGRHISELSAREWRLSLQMIERFAIFAGEEASAGIASKEKQNVQAQAQAPGSPVRSSTPTLREGTGDEESMAASTALAVDILWHGERIKTVFEHGIKPLVVHAGGQSVTDTDEILQGLKSALIDALGPQMEIVALLRGRVVAALKAQCAEPLRLVRSLSSQYRNVTVQDKSAAQEPSHFVAHFLRPVRQYLGKSESSARSRQADKSSDLPSLVFSALLPRAVREEWVAEIIEDFLARYTTSLHTMNQNYVSLQRLKRVNAGTASVKASDDEASGMHLQMMADVEALEHEVRALESVGCSIPTDTPAWDRLRKAAGHKPTIGRT